jgi:hypothetical protein
MKTDEKEYYDLDTDPYQLENTYPTTDPALIATLKDQLSALRVCERQACRAAEN